VTSDKSRISYERRAPLNCGLKWSGGLSVAIYENGTLVRYESYVGR